jgi:hypothetical protein
MNTMHIEVKDFLERIFREEGVVINKIDADWIDISTHNNKDFLLQVIEIESESRPN